MGQGSIIANENKHKQKIEKNVSANYSAILILVLLIW